MQERKCELSQLLGINEFEIGRHIMQFNNRKALVSNKGGA